MEARDDVYFEGLDESQQEKALEILNNRLVSWRATSSFTYEVIGYGGGFSFHVMTPERAVKHQLCVSTEGMASFTLISLEGSSYDQTAKGRFSNSAMLEDCLTPMP